MSTVQSMIRSGVGAHSLPRSTPYETTFYGQLALTLSYVEALSIALFGAKSCGSVR